MGLFSVAKLFGITLRESANDGSDFTNPDADYRRLFLGEDALLHLRDSAGAVTGVGAGGLLKVSEVTFTSNVSVTATTEGTGNTVVTAGAVTFDGATPCILEFYCWAAQPDNTAANRALRLGWVDGGTAIGVFSLHATQVAGVNNLIPIFARSSAFTPTAASHTYGVESWVSAGTGTVGAGAGGAGANMPGFIRVYKVIV